MIVMKTIQLVFTRLLSIILLKMALTLEDVNALIEKIDDALEISHRKIKETTETYFHDYECRWSLIEGIYIKLSWSTNDTSGNIGHIQLLLVNEVNGEAK